MKTPLHRVMIDNNLCRTQWKEGGRGRRGRRVRRREWQREVEGGGGGGCRTERREQQRKKHTPVIQVGHLLQTVIFVYAQLCSHSLQLRIWIKNWVSFCNQNSKSLWGPFAALRFLSIKLNEVVSLTFQRGLYLWALCSVTCAQWPHCLLSIRWNAPEHPA